MKMSEFRDEVSKKISGSDEPAAIIKATLQTVREQIGAGTDTLIPNLGRFKVKTLQNGDSRVVFKAADPASRSDDSSV